MSIVAGLLAAKTAYDVGKGAFDWLNAKNKKFKMTPEERRAKTQAAQQAALGSGGQSFQNAANQLRGQSIDASKSVRESAFASGLENSAVTSVGQQKVNSYTNSQLADLALKISDRNSQFRENASQRSESINMQIGERKRQFNERKKLEMREAAGRTITSLFSMGIKAAQAKEATNQTAALAAESEKVNAAITPIMGHLKGGDVQAALAELAKMKDLELDQIDVTQMMKTIKSYALDISKDKDGTD